MEKRDKIIKTIYKDEVVLVDHINTRYFFCSIERLKYVFDYALNLEGILYFGFNLDIYESTIEEICDVYKIRQKDQENLHKFLKMMKSFQYIKGVSYVEITDDLRLWIILNKNYTTKFKTDIGKKISLSILNNYDFWDKSPTGMMSDESSDFFVQRVASKIPPKK